MEPRDETARQGAPPASDTAAVDLPLGDATRPFPRVAVPPRVAGPQLVPAVPAELSGMLLPTEHVTFGSSPHWIVLVRPLVEIVLVLLLLAVALSWRLVLIVHGHHVLVPLLAGYGRLAALGLAGLLVLRALIALAGRAVHYFGYRIVTTNRRVFVVEGLFGRRVRPLGNTALAGSTMSQGVLGRMLDFGTLVLGGGGPAVRDMRDPVRLYREFEAVANGVDGDTWTPALRQTQIP
jgi:PH (Pleckstrin Homology) domain-containing protein